MKKYLLILSLALAGSTVSFGQTTIQEQYFHELKGMEDSNGVTHLFYRRYEKSTFQCAPGNDNDIVEHGGDNVFHYNTDAKSDSIIFREGYGEWCLAGMYDSYGVRDFAFYNNDPAKWIVYSYYEYTVGISDYQQHSLNIQPPIVVKRNSSLSADNYWVEQFYLSPNDDSLYIDAGVTIPFAGHGENWPLFNTYEDYLAYADSTFIEFKILAIHPVIDSLYFSTNQAGVLYRSEHYTRDFSLADSLGYYGNLHFDPDTLHLYSLQNGTIRRSDNLGKSGSWDILEPPHKTDTPTFIVIDNSESGHLFLSDSTSILYSYDYGETFSELITLEHKITGLHKKPNSTILYVLTTEALLEVDLETQQVTTLREIPVSSEPEPSEIPNQISLHQNYPNPFNPTTKISYQLNQNSLVRLGVFDVTGRKVAVLVGGERKAAGTHQVTFEAGDLASGVYFYRLETAGQTLTQKMLLVK